MALANLAPCSVGGGMRRLAGVAGAVLIGLASPAAAQIVAPVQTLDGLDGAADIKFRFYDVPGTDPRAIREGLKRLGPTDETDGKRVDALTRWSYNWRWQSRTTAGVCKITSVTLDLSIEVTLPRLSDANRLSGGTRDRWNVYMIALRRHELGHVEIARKHMDAIRRAVESASCAEANDAARSLLATVRDENARYDVETRHGARQGVVFP